MTREEARNKARELISKMTIEEKADQLLYCSDPIERLGINGYNWWNEALHGVARAGVATVFPQAIGLAASFDPKFVGEIADVISTEARAKYNCHVEEKDFGIYKGLTMWSPNINIFRDPRWGRGQETYGEDPYLTASIGCEFVSGLQGDGEFLKVSACAKHLAVHSGPEKLRHTFNAKCSQKDLFETYLPAFERLVKDAKVEGVMGAYNRTNDEACCAHSQLMDDVLFSQWGFEGYFVSDCGAICNFHKTHMITPDGPHSAALALNHRCNVNCGGAYTNILKALEDGLVTEELIDENLEKALTTRVLLGEFEETRPYLDVDFDLVDCEEHRLKNLEAARRSLVLLKNDGTLPLDREAIKKIAVVGPNAMSRSALSGNYCGLASEYVTVTDGVRKVHPDARIYSAMGTRLFDDDTEHAGGISTAVEAAKRADIAVVCLGLDPDCEGEELSVSNDYCDGGDRTTVALPAIQKKLLSAVCDACDKVIAVVMQGSCCDIGEELLHRVSALVHAWYPGAQGGNAIAELIFGDFSPSGRLPVTFYREDDDIKDICDYSMEGRTYRFINTEPRFSFGYGLGYSGFEYTDATLLSNDGEDITLSVNVTNTGKMDAREITQVYASFTDSRTVTPNFQLCALSSNMIPAKETVSLTLKISDYWLKAVNEKGERINPNGSLSLYVGGHQPDRRSCDLCGECVEIKIN